MRTKAMNRGGHGWRERTVRLTKTTLTLFEGPGTDVLVVVHGQRVAGKPAIRREKIARTK